MLGVDDELLKNTSRSIPRADVAELTVQCLSLAEADNRCFELFTPDFSKFSTGFVHYQGFVPATLVETHGTQCVSQCRSIDVITKPPGEGTPTTDFAALLASLKKDCQYGAVAKPALTV